MGWHIRIDRPHRAAVMVLGVLGWLAWTPSTAAAAGHTCQRTGETVTISFGPLRSVVVRRDGDRIDVNGRPCSTATVQNTTEIDVIGSKLRNRFQIDLRGGQFVDRHGRRIPFHVDLAQLWDKVSVLGTNGPDRIRFGTLGINLDSDAGSQVDVTLTRVERIIVRAQLGDDIVSANGGFGTGHDSILPGVDTLFGGIGRDLLVGSRRSRTSSSHLSILHGKCKRRSCRGKKGVDYIHGGLGDDTISGLGGNDHLWGDEDNDTIHGDGGTDECVGGTGNDDTASYCQHNGTNENESHNDP